MCHRWMQIQKKPGNDDFTPFPGFPSGAYLTPIKKAGNRNRTGDLRTTNATHYRLCYASIPFPLENFYTLSWRPCSVNHEFTFFVKSLCGHYFAHNGTAQIYGYGAYLRCAGRFLRALSRSRYEGQLSCELFREKLRLDLLRRHLLSGPELEGGCALIQ